jgi:hypothetical protein
MRLQLGSVVDCKTAEASAVRGQLSNRIKDLDQFKPGQTINMAITDEMVVEAVHS